MKPGYCPFDEPTMPSQALFRFNSTTSNSRLHAEFNNRSSISRRIISLIGMKFIDAMNWSANNASNGWDVLNHRFDRDGVGYVCSRKSKDEWKPTGVNKKMLFAACFPTIRGARTGSFAPFFARTVVLSRMARCRSMSPFFRNRRMITACRRDQTPASCQARIRRQAVTPLPQPRPRGMCRQAIPVTNTYMMASVVSCGWWMATAMRPQRPMI